MKLMTKNQHLLDANSDGPHQIIKDEYFFFWTA